VTVIAGNDNDASGTAGCMEKGIYLSESFRRPRQIQLIAPRELCIDGVMHDSDDALLRVAHRSPDLVA
jgi:hypothetical protein